MVCKIFSDNLYNTNEEFDYGGFRELLEAQSQTQTSVTLFAYRFSDPGVYAFYLSSDVNKRFVRYDVFKGNSCRRMNFLIELLFRCSTYEFCLLKRSALRTAPSSRQQVVTLFRTVSRSTKTFCKLLIGWSSSFSSSPLSSLSASSSSLWSVYNYKTPNRGMM